MNKWSSKSQAQYDTLHLDLKTLCDAVLIVHDCSILYGNRGKELQNQLFADGKSTLKYPDSKHNTLPSIAVDLLPYRRHWNPYGQGSDKYSAYFSGIVLGIAERLLFEGHMKYKIRWGGNWSTIRNKDFASFYDAYHFELLL